MDGGNRGRKEPVFRFILFLSSSPSKSGRMKLLRQRKEGIKVYIQDVVRDKRRRGTIYKSR